LEVLEEIRRGEAPPPVVMVTGRGDEGVAVEAMKRGAYDYVVKQEGYLERLPVVARRAVEANRMALERKQAEEALKKSEERFRTSAETLLEGFAILSAVRDSNGQIIDFKYEYINKAGCKMNQKPHEEHMGKTLLELLPTHKEIGLFDEYVRVVETGQPLTKEFLIYEAIYGGGKRLRQAFDVRITRLGDGFVTTWQDITNKKKGEELLRQSEERLRLLIENSKDVVIMADLEGSLIYYNGPPEYGITAEEALGKNPFSIFEPVIAASLMNQLKLVIKGGEVLTFENVIPWKGESFWFLNQMYPIRDEKGRMIAVGLIARNITERKRAEEELKKEKGRVQKYLDIAGVMLVVLNAD
jgi:PAS domain S-box-containing protein